MTIPLLILGDSPSAVTGLGRICRDISLRIHTHLSDIYDVATLGYGGFGDRSLPFMQYSIESMHDWFIPTLPDVWNDFAGDHPGIIMTIWDASRLLWFARPDNPQWCADGRMREWLQHAKIKKWGYFPIDAVGPNGKLSVMQRECILGYDRILAYTNWAKRIIDNTIDREVDAIPHGIDAAIFKPQPRDTARRIFHEQLQFTGPSIEDSEKLIGIIATNQIRKDWGLAIESLARVAKDHPIRIYAQCDILERHWSLPALLMDYCLIPNTIVNCSPVSDELMSYIYSACDMTLGIGLGEGFGYPIFESLACGTPCLTGSYGGQAEHMPKEMLIDPVAWRLEGPYDCRRPVFDSEKWAYRIWKLLRQEKTGRSLLPQHLDWNNLWSKWEQWFRSGQIRHYQEEIPVLSDNRLETDMAQSDQSMSKAALAEDPSGIAAGIAALMRDRKS